MNRKFLPAVFAVVVGVAAVCALTAAEPAVMSSEQPATTVKVDSETAGQPVTTPAPETQPAPAAETHVDGDSGGGAMAALETGAVDSSAGAIKSDDAAAPVAPVTSIAPQAAIDECAMKSGVEKDACLLKQRVEHKEVTPVVPQAVPTPVVPQPAGGEAGGINVPK